MTSWCSSRPCKLRTKLSAGALEGRNVTLLEALCITWTRGVATQLKYTAVRATVDKTIITLIFFIIKAGVAVALFCK